MWIKTQSGIIVNSDAVREFGSEYQVLEDDGLSRYSWYDFFAFGVGLCDHRNGRKVYPDEHRAIARYLNQKELRLFESRFWTALQHDQFFDAKRVLQEIRAQHAWEKKVENMKTEVTT